LNIQIDVEGGLTDLSKWSGCIHQVWNTLARLQEATQSNITTRNHLVTRSQGKEVAAARSWILSAY